MMTFAPQLYVFVVLELLRFDEFCSTRLDQFNFYVFKSIIDGRFDNDATDDETSMIFFGLFKNNFQNFKL